MTAKVLKSQAFKLKGRLYTFTVLQVLSSNPELFQQQLEEIIAKAPKLFESAPIVLDFSALDEAEVDLQRLCQLIKEKGMIPVAIQGGSAFLETLAQCQGLAILKASSMQDKVPAKAKDRNSQAFSVLPSKLLTSPVRSGQQIVAKGSDLVITASVSHGAELLADGNIHVYGALRGRALAGISGNTEARIFCRSLEAELVSIAGFYRLSEAIDQQTGPCQIYLHNEHIQIEPL